jgi:VCBS repeat-containing protein
MVKKLLSLLVLTILVTSLLVGCGGGSPSPTPTTVATLSEIEGDVSVRETGTGTWAEGQVGMSLVVGDTVKTGNDSSAEITFLDGNTMELEADTEIEITSVSTDTGGTTVTITQTIGTVLTRLTQLLDPGSSYETVTSSGVTGVRAKPANPATAIVGVTGNGTTWVVNQKGDVRTEGQGIELLVPQGQRGLIMPGLPPGLMPPNRPPMAQDDAFVTGEHHPLTIARPGVLFNDFDPDIYDLLHVIAVNTTGTLGVVSNWGPRGAFTYDPNGQFDYLEAGNSATDSFTYTISDACGDNATATVTITINGVD